MKMKWRFVLGCLVVLVITSQDYISADSSDDDDDGGYDNDQLPGTFSEHDKRELDSNVRAMKLTSIAFKMLSGCYQTTCPDDCLLSFIDGESSFGAEDFKCPTATHSIQKRARWWNTSRNTASPPSQ